jgi:hypothetical protein
MTQTAAIEGDVIGPTAEKVKRGRSVAISESAGQSVALTPMEMISRAVSSGAGMDVVEKLMDLQDRWDKSQARRAFDEALAAAKAEMPVIAKNRHVGFDSKKSGAARTDYRHEDLAEIARTVDPILGKHGLSYRFRTTSKINEPISVTCIVSHRLGHSEENTLSAGRDDSGNKNSIQAIGSTITYLQRYTLKAALGLAASNDDDGKAADEDSGPATITQEQADTLVELLEAKGKDRAKFLKWAKVERIEEIRADVYQSCVDAISAPVRA